jgi:hypothetical protein
LQIQRLVIAAQELRQLVIKDLYNLLPRRNGAQNILSQRLALNSGNEVLGDLKMNVRFQQSQTNLPERIIDVSLRDGAMAPEVLEYVLKLVG